MCRKYHASCKTAKQAMSVMYVFFFCLITPLFCPVLSPIRHLTVLLQCCLDLIVACGWRRSSGASSTSLKRRLKGLFTEVALPYFCPFLMVFFNLNLYFFCIQAQHFCHMYQPGIMLSELEASVGRVTLARKQSEAVQLTV